MAAGGGVGDSPSGDRRLVTWLVGAVPGDPAGSWGVLVSPGIGSRGPCDGEGERQTGKQGVGMRGDLSPPEGTTRRASANPAASRTVCLAVCRELPCSREQPRRISL